LIAKLSIPSESKGSQIANSQWHMANSNISNDSERSHQTMRKPNARSLRSK
jgi:hypothetical protein